MLRAPRVRLAAQLLGLLAAVAVVYSGVRRGGWIWDDTMLISQNREITAADGLRQVWFHSRSPDFFPLTASVEWIEWHLSGGCPVAFHYVSIGLHCLSAFLLWRLLVRLRLRFAWVGALFFAVHPIAVESVAWISEQKNALSLPPLLLSVLNYVEYDAQQRRTALVYALLWFWVALLCKTSVVVLPPILVAYVIWKHGRLSRHDVWSTAPFFVSATVCGLITVWFQQHRAMSELVAPLGGVMSRLACFGLCISFYAAKICLPVGLTSVYPRWSVDALSAFHAVPWIGGAVALATAWRYRSTWGRHALFGVGTFILCLAPVAGLVGMAFFRYSWVADHFAYLALAAAGGLFAAVLQWIRAQGYLAPGPLMSLCGFVLLPYVLLARQHALVFRGERSLWTDILRQNPSAWLADNNLGQVELQENRRDAAIALFEQALTKNPDYPEAHGNLGVALAQAGRTTEALLHLRRCVALQPRVPEAHLNLANGLVQAGDWTAAVSEYQETLRLAPKNVSAELNLGNTYLALNRPDDALACYQNAVADAPDNASAHADLGAVLLRLHRFQEAVTQLAHVTQMSPEDAMAHGNLGFALIQSGHVDEGVAEFQQAVRLQPNSAQTHSNLGSALARQGRLRAAATEYELALRLDPGSAETRENLRRIEAARGR